MFVCYECCVLSGRGLCDELITLPEESYRLWCVVVCDQETTKMRRPLSVLGRSATGNKTKLTRIQWLISSSHLQGLVHRHLYCRTPDRTARMAQLQFERKCLLLELSFIFRSIFFFLWSFYKNEYFVLLGQNDSRISVNALPILILRFWGNPSRHTSPLLTSPVSGNTYENSGGWLFPRKLSTDVLNCVMWRKLYTGDDR